MKTTYKSGYSGRDEMRRRAERMMGDDMREVVKPRESKSAPAKTPIRPYRKGGPVRHGLYSQKRKKAAPVKMERIEISESTRSLPEQRRMHLSDGTRKRKFSFGGVMGEIMRGIPLINMVTGPIADAAHLKRGGSPKEKKKFGLGGVMAGAALSPIVDKIPKVGKYMAQNLGMFSHLLPFAEGGEVPEKMNKRHGGKCSRRYRAEGGDISESQETMRRGGPARRMRRADGGGIPDSIQEPLLIRNAKRRWVDNHPNGAQFSDGGEVEKKEKFAIGGAGKVRKRQATQSGMPIKLRHSRRRG